MKKFIAIIFPFLFLTASAQDLDSLSDVIGSKTKNEIFRQLSEQRVFDYQDKVLPSFKLKQINGSEFDSKSLIGKPTLINFWFTSCAPCLEEIPLLNQIKESHSQEVNFVAITFEDSDEITAFLDGNPFNFVQLVDAKDFIRILDVKTYPRTLITDKDLVIRFISKGKPKDLAALEMELRNQINEVLKH